MLFVPTHLPPSQATDQAWCFAFVQRELLLPADDGAAGLRPVPARWLIGAADAQHYLGTLAGHDCWALALPEVPPGWQATPLRTAMMALDSHLGALAGRAAQVLEWDRSHRFCGVCGTATTLQPGERARICPACGHSAYPRLSPSMMALVWRPGELLLARSPHFRPGMYSALAGFVEAGESLEDCVHREVAEEVAVQVADLRYFGSQSWPFPHSLMLACTARWVGGEIVPQPGEIEHAAWFPLDALPQIPPRFSIAGHLIRDTLAAMGQDGPAWA
ncbi:MAG: NADH pyrophosphatase [Burkholderiales bacterium PBB5]|nr:MAG: NADH pyrophosphatase [Burkholderiales bacterium PBB5]